MAPKTSFRNSETGHRICTERTILSHVYWTRPNIKISFLNAPFFTHTQLHTPGLFHPIKLAIFFLSHFSFFFLTLRLPSPSPPPKWHILVKNLMTKLKHKYFLNIQIMANSLLFVFFFSAFWQIFLKTFGRKKEAKKKVVTKNLSKKN